VHRRQNTKYYDPEIEDGIWINLWCFEDMAYCYDSFSLSSVVAPDEKNILLEGNGLFYFKKTEWIQIINLITNEVVVSFDHSNEIFSLLDQMLNKPDI
jgi:protein associated with RNAse G/E